MCQPFPLNTAGGRPRTRAPFFGLKKHTWWRSLFSHFRCHKRDLQWRLQKKRFSIFQDTSVQEKRQCAALASVIYFLQGMCCGIHPPWLSAQFLFCVPKTFNVLQASSPATHVSHIYTGIMSLCFFCLPSRCFFCAGRTHQVLGDHKASMPSRSDTQRPHAPC